MDFASRQDVSEQGPFVRFLPARRSVTESNGFWDDADEELTSALQYAIDHAYVPRTTTKYGAFFDALEEMLAGDKSVEDALTEAKTQAEADIEEAQAEEAETTPVPTVVVAARSDEEAADENAVKITFSPNINAFNIQAYRDAAQQFNEAHPDIQVEVEMPNFIGGTPTIISKHCFPCFY